MAETRPKTLPEKIWDRHLVASTPGESDLIYIDLHLIHRGWPPSLEVLLEGPVCLLVAVTSRQTSAAAR